MLQEMTEMLSHITWSLILKRPKGQTPGPTINTARLVIVLHSGEQQLLILCSVLNKTDYFLVSNLKPDFKGTCLTVFADAFQRGPDDSLMSFSFEKQARNNVLKVA